jgi:hypothetical protein
MSQIDDDTLHRLAGPLFDALVAAAPLRRPPFPLGPDARLSSYYVVRQQTFMRRSDFDAPSCMDLEDFERRLAAYWKKAGHPELAGRAPLVAEAARALHALYRDKQPEPEVSACIYVL